MRKLRSLSRVSIVVAIVLFGIYFYREILHKDQTGPVFKMENEVIEISVQDGEEQLLQGITATDAADGDVTNSIIVEAVSPFTGTGHRIVTYAVFDSDNHVTHAKRELRYKDYTPPRFYFDKPLSYPMNATNLLNGIHAEDCIDGDISRNIRMVSENELDTAHVGDYNARLKVSNSAGGVSYLPVTIEIYDASVHYKTPQIKLNEYIVYVEKGSDFDEYDYLDSLYVNGTDYAFVEDGSEESYGTWRDSQTESDRTVSYERVDVDGDVNTTITGCYEINYSFEDNVFDTGIGSTRLYVVVIEGVADENA